MKLRVRSIETKETLRVEVPNNLCSLDHLKQTIARSIPAAHHPSSLRLSLNRRDELHASSPHVSLLSVGLTSGDLIFYTFDPSPQTLARPPPPPPVFQSSVQSPTLIAGTAGGPQGSNPSIPETLIGEESASSNLETLIATASTAATGGPQGSNSPIPETLIGIESSTHNSILGSNSEALVASGAGSMEIDGLGFDGLLGLEKYAEPFFLKRVLREELGEEEEGHSNHKLLVIAVHAVLLESGFVGFDTESGMQASRFHSKASVSYTLPGILQNRGNSGDGIDGIVLKFQSLGCFVNVYGSLTNGGSGVYRVCLDEGRFGPLIESVWRNRNVNGRDGLVSELGVFEFWRFVKDGIALPLLIDVCAKAGLPAPPSLMGLPAELKMKILKRLPGADIAKVGSVCKELQSLANNDELWKRKFDEEFGSGTGREGTITSWKARFVRDREMREQQRKPVVRWRAIDRPYHNRIRRDPNPLFVPPISGIIGGDYDRFPAFGVLDPTGEPHNILQPPPMPGLFPARRNSSLGRFPARRNFSPNCNLGGFSG